MLDIAPEDINATQERRSKPHRCGLRSKMIRKISFISMLLVLVLMVGCTGKRPEKAESEEYAEMTVIEESSSEESSKEESSVRESSADEEEESESSVEESETTPESSSEEESEESSIATDSYVPDETTGVMYKVEVPEMTVEGIDEGLLKAIDGNVEGLEDAVEEFFLYDVTHSVTDTVYVEKYDAESWQNMCGIWLRTQEEDEDLIYIYYTYETKEFNSTQNR